MWRGIVDGRAGCLDVALGVIDGGRAGRGGQVCTVDGVVDRSLMGCSMEVVRWLLWGVQLRWAG